LQEIKPDDRDIVESAMNLWTSLVSDVKHEEQNLKIDSEFLGKGIHQCKNLRIREIFRTSFHSVCKVNKKMQTQLLQVLLSELTKVESLGKNTREFFGLYSDMITEVLKNR
jgi:hypothetical protein